MQNKTLLAKIVGLIAVMCFALSMVFGLVGCGNAKTISKTSINENGHLIVTYSDDTTEDLGSVIGPKGDKGDQGETGEVHDCAHENSFIFDKCTLDMYNLMVGEENAANGDDFCYFELSVCKDCGYVTAEFTTDHVYAETTVAPTCTEEGYTGLVCTECGYAIEKTEIVPALGHAYETNYYTQYADSTKSFCVDGGFVAAICTRCGEELDEATFVRGLGHQSLEWTVTVAPTTTTAGTLTGICEVCGKAAATRTLPKLDKVNYSYELNNEVRNAADVDKDNYEYSITIKFEEYTFDEETNTFVKSVRLDEEGNEIAQTFSFSELQPHKTNNVEYLGKADIDDYVVDMNGIKLFGNSGDLKCDEYIPAYFICEECGEAITVNVKKAHTAPDSDSDYYNVTYATCTVPGVRHYTCTECGTSDLEEVIKELGHDYQYAIQTIPNSEKVNIIITCSRGDYTDTIRNIEAEIEEKPATCEADGYRKYTYTPEGATEPTTLTEVLHQLKHRFVDGDINERLDDTKVYPYEQYNFTPFGNVELGCGDSANMYFTCADCNKPIIVKVIKEHVIPDDDEIDLEPTCTVDGSNTYTCEVCHNTITDVIDKLGHEYVLKSAVPGTITGKLNVTIGCKSGDFEETYLNCTYVEVVTKPATCTETGKKNLIITVDGYDEPFTIQDVVIDKLAHTYNGEAIDVVNAYPAGTSGLTVTGNNPENCQGEGKGIIWCDDCKQPILVNVKGPHTIVEGTLVEHEATCTEKAYKEFTCSVCGEDITEYTGPALGHDYVITVVNKATADAEGTAVITCSRCDFREEVVLPVISEDNYVIDPEAACNAEGLGTYTYEKTLENGDKVSITFTDEIPTTDHHFVAGMDKIFTYTDENEVTWKYTAKLCNDCHEYVIVSIEDISGRA